VTRRIFGGTRRIKIGSTFNAKYLGSSLFKIGIELVIEKKEEKKK